MWVVFLIKKPRIDDFRSDYFPRRFYYKKDAQALADEVQRKGGEVQVEKVKN